MGFGKPNISISKSLHPEKVTLWAALFLKGIYRYFFDSMVTGNSYKVLLETKFFPFARTRGWVQIFYFMQDGAGPIASKKCSRLFTMYMKNEWLVQHLKIWTRFELDFNPCDFFLWGYIKDHCYSENSTTEELMKAIRKTVNNISKKNWLLLEWWW